MPHKDIICGIYCITTPSGSQYVGSSCNVKRRWCEHRYALNKAISGAKNSAYGYTWEAA